MTRRAASHAARRAGSRHRPWPGAAPALCLCLLGSLLTPGAVQTTAASTALGAPAPAPDAADVDLLLEFTQEVDNWSSFAADNNLTGWTADGASVCAWQGVSCRDNSGDIVGINLACDGCETQLQGPLPDVLAKMPQLQALSLAGNSLSGSLPDAWGVAGAFPELTDMDLNSNQLSGMLPLEWAAANHLQLLSRLNLSSNEFTGSVPADWLEPGAFPEMTALDLANNQISGDLDEGWAAAQVLPELKILSLAGNNMSGSLPDAWAGAAAFPALVELDLSRNSFEGTLPTAWGTAAAFPNLTALSLYGNQLDGGLPLYWGQAGSLAQLETLYLDRNFLSGSLPPQWATNNASWPRLRTLGLSSCGLSGTLPANWGSNGSFPRLTDLFLSYNKLSGTVPASWSALTSLHSLWLRPANYQLCGTIPTGLDFTVCANNGSCVPTNLTCQAEQPDASMVEVVVNILGYNLDPFTTNQQEGLKAAMVNELPELQSPDNITILFVQQTNKPLLNIASDIAPSPSSEILAPASIGNVTVPGGLGGTTTPASTLSSTTPAGRKLLRTAGGSGRRLRRALRQNVPASEVFASTTSPLEAVAVTMNLQTNSSDAAAQLSGNLPYVVSYSQGLLEQLQADGINATETQLIFNSGAPVTVAGAQGPGSDGFPFGADNSGQQVPSSGGDNSHTIELVIGIVSGVVVAALLGILASVFLLWRRARGRAAAGAALSVPPAGHRWPKMPKVFSNGSNRSAGSAQESGGSTPPETGRGLVFPPLNIGETGIDIDLDNLFRSAGANSDPGSEGGGAGLPVELPRVPFSDWELRPQDIKISTRPDGRQWEIGSGAFGQVYKAVLGGVQTVAVKMLAGRQDPAAQAKFCREVAILRSCRNSNIVQFQGACVSEGATMLVTEFMEGGDLWRILSRDTDRSVFGWYKRGKQVALDVAGGLHWLHSHRIVHFDLKSQNILLARDGTAKIADVGLARILNRDYVTSLDMAGTFAWAAPELLLGSRCTEKVDIYSFGIVLWELVTGERPLRGQTRELRVPEECPAEVDALISACMAADPSVRPSAKEIHEALVNIQYPATMPRAASLPKHGTMLSGMGGPMSVGMAAGGGGGGPSLLDSPPLQQADQGQAPLTAPVGLSPVASCESSLQAGSPRTRCPLPPDFLGGDAAPDGDTPRAGESSSRAQDSESSAHADKPPAAIAPSSSSSRSATSGAASGMATPQQLQSWMQQGINPFAAAALQQGGGGGDSARPATATPHAGPQQGGGAADDGRMPSPFASPFLGSGL